MSFLVFVFISASLLNGILGAPASTYDQQQNGELNVRVDLKDIEIVALLNSGLGDYGDYDYAYDYSDFTLKPVTPHVTSPAASISSAASTTPTPTPKTKATTTTTTTVKPWNTWPTIASIVPVESSSENPGAGERLALNPPASESAEGDQKEEEEAAIGESEINFAPVKGNEESTASSSNVEPSAVTESQSRPLRRCNPGLARDQRGRCRLHIRRRIAGASSFLPYGIRLNPQTDRIRDQPAEN